MKCINCGSELPEGAKFCFSCGAKQPEEVFVPEEVITEDDVTEETLEETAEEAEYEAEPETETAQEPEYEAEPESAPEYEAEPETAGGFKFCPHCGARNDADAVFCCSCGNNMTMNLAVAVTPEPEVYYQPKKKVPVKLIAGGIAAAAVVVIAVKVISGLMGGGENMYVTYLKDGNVNQIDLEHYKKEPVEYDGRYGSYEDVKTNVKIQYSKDGKYIFYPTGCEYGPDGMEYRLNMQKVGKKDAAVKIDSSVRKYSVLENNKVVYIKTGSNTLYINDKKGNKEKIASDVQNYYIDKEEKNIVWIEKYKDKYSIYQQDLALKKDDRALVKDVDEYDIKDDLKQIVVKEEDILYIIKDLGEKEKISSGVEYLLANNEKGGCVYYVKNAEKKLMAADLVEDDCAESDKTITEPSYDNFKVEKVQKDNWTGKYEKVMVTDYDAYDKAYETYKGKVRRDEMRENLGEQEVYNQCKELYCYKDGKASLVDEAFSENHSDSDAEELVFNRYDMKEIPKIKLSELEYSGQVEDKYRESMQKAVQTCVYTGGKIITLDEVLNGSVVVDSKAKKGYGIKIEGEEQDTTLLSFSIDTKADGGCKTVAEDVGSILGVQDEKIYYLTDMKEGAGELYCNDKDVDSDVADGFLVFMDEDVFYAADVDTSRGGFTLKLYDGKNDIKIADDVHDFKAFDKKHIAVLVDFSMDRYKGDLKFYRGKEDLVNLDEDVNAIFNATR